MANRHRVKGIILGKTDYKENDQIFDIYTIELGKIKILGKAVRKIKSKLRSGLGIMSCTEIEFVEGKTNKVLTATQSQKKFSGIFFDLSKLKYAYLVSDVLNRLVHYEERDDKIFELLDSTLESIELLKAEGEEKKIKFLKLIYSYFFWNLVSHLGYKIDLYNCCSCNSRLSPNELSFSHEREGILCLRCQRGSYEEVRIYSETVKIIRFFLSNNWDYSLRLAISDKCLDDIEKFGSRYLQHIMGITRVVNE